MRLLRFHFVSIDPLGNNFLLRYHLEEHRINPAGISLSSYIDAIIDDDMTFIVNPSRRWLFSTMKKKINLFQNRLRFVTSILISKTFRSTCLTFASNLSGKLNGSCFASLSLSLSFISKQITCVNVD